MMTQYEFVNGAVMRCKSIEPIAGYGDEMKGKYRAIEAQRLISNVWENINNCTFDIGGVVLSYELVETEGNA